MFVCSDGDFLHETDVNNEEEFYGSDDGYRDPYDGYKDPYDGQYQASENITSTAPLLNYQSFMEKTPRGKWSTGDTEKFYEAIRQFGTDFTMIQQLFPDKTRHQIKLKYKKEERQHPLLLSDAVNNPTKDLSLFKLVIERQIQKSKEEQDAAGDASDLMPGEEVEEPTTPGTNEEVAKPQQEQDHINVKDQEDSMPVPGQSDDDDDDDDDGEDPLLKWSQYQSSI
ncbi:transcription factor TFIIIB component [Trifolium pratense]|uniref:Transcription factor TFIIIB component n=1 Tax=Trifolium pratense TaxID=57577 RepID=A0A2K3PEE5_TRIPR|nr:transcription factor TFIIIB component [Trifolium pratense]